MTMEKFDALDEAAKESVINIGIENRSTFLEGIKYDASRCRWRVYVSETGTGQSKSFYPGKGDSEEECLKKAFLEALTFRREVLAVRAQPQTKKKTRKLQGRFSRERKKRKIKPRKLRRATRK